jgi:DNA-directed RNA polymerase specialized sigma24 family protein
MDLPAPQENAEGYLKRAVTNRLRDHGRRFAAQKRDRKREVGIGAASLVAARSVSPSRILGAQEDLTRLLNALDPTQRAVAEARMADIGWEEIADGTDDGSDTIRKRYCRAVKLALQSLGVGAGDGHLTPLE